MSDHCANCGAPIESHRVRTSECEERWSRWRFDRAAVLREAIEGLSDDQCVRLAAIREHERIGDRDTWKMDVGAFRAALLRAVAPAVPNEGGP